MMLYTMGRNLLILSCLVIQFATLISQSQVKGLCGFAFNARISTYSIQYNFTVSETSDDIYSLDLHVWWDRPDFDHDAYEVRIVWQYTREVTTNIECNAPNYIRTTQESYVFRDLIFGYEYSIWILLYDSTRDQSSFNPAIKNVKTPDCYTVTQSLTFCSSQPIPFASPVRDVIAECQSTNMYGNLTDIVISWLPPVQVNGSLSQFYTSVRKSSKVAFEAIYRTTVSQHEADRNLSYRFNQLVEGLIPNVTYVIQVKSLIQRNNETLRYFGEIVEETIVPMVAMETSIVMNDNDSTLNCVPFEPSPTPQEQYESPKLSLWAVLGSMAGMTSVMALMFVVLITKKRSVAVKRTEFIRYPDGVSMIANNVIKEAGNDIHSVTKNVDPVFASKELDRSHLEVGEELGKGSFGIVFKGLVYGLDGNQKYTPVAVKSLRVGANEAMKLEFLDEIRLIVEIGTHPNILPLLGCCTADEPFYLVTELMKYGDLLHFLIKCQDPSNAEVDPIYNLNSTMQVQIAIQIARGMEYISSTRYYHGDLAARNVLVGDHLVVKISDFGLADDIYQRGYKRLAPSKKRPVKWVSLETNLEGRCTIESDVWSFGIVLYEIYTRGRSPYENIDGQVVINKLKEGYRLQKPEECPEDMYTLMLHCWQERPSSRPSFTDIYNTLDTILSESSDYLTNLDPPEKTPNDGGISNTSCFTDETDIESMNSLDRYSSLLISPGSHLNDTDSDYSEDGAVTYEIEQIPQSVRNNKHIASIPTIIVNSSATATGGPKKRSTAFINESYESHPV